MVSIFIVTSEAMNWQVNHALHKALRSHKQISSSFQQDKMIMKSVLYKNNNNNLKQVNVISFKIGDRMTEKSLM